MVRRKKRRFLFVSPHPDDVELGIGGTIIKLRQAGHKVFVVDLTTGEPTPYGTQEKRKREAQQATEILGLEARINLHLENRYLFDTKEARLLLANQIRRFKPDVLFSPYREDAHPDHIACQKIVEGARFYAKYTKIDSGARPHYPFYLFYYFCIHLRTIPKFTFLVDISSQIKEKMRAIRCYRSQFVENYQNRFIFDYLLCYHRFLGTLIRTRYAEAIYSPEAIKIDDLAHLL